MSEPVCLLEKTLRACVDGKHLKTPRAGCTITEMQHFQLLGSEELERRIALRCATAPILEAHALTTANIERLFVSTLSSVFPAPLGVSGSAFVKAIAGECVELGDAECVATVDELVEALIEQSTHALKLKFPLIDLCAVHSRQLVRPIAYPLPLVYDADSWARAFPVLPTQLLLGFARTISAHYDLRSILEIHTLSGADKYVLTAQPRDPLRGVSSTFNNAQWIVEHQKLAVARNAIALAVLSELEQLGRFNFQRCLACFYCDNSSSKTDQHTRDMRDVTV